MRRDNGDLLDRRRLLGLAVTAPLLALGGAAWAQEPATCLDVDAMPASQKGMRRALGFKLQSPDPKKRCAGCTFYTAKGSCGTCALLSGGVVAAQSVCDSWAAKR